MNNEKRKRISVYLKAGRKAGTPYYRFYQYFDKIDALFEYHLMIPDKRWNAFFPIAIQSLWKKVFIFFYIYIRILWYLAKDVVRKPDCIVVSRCLINLVLPISYKMLIKIAKRRGVKIIFDFDDQIILGREVTRSGFDFFTDVSDSVIVGSPLLKNLVCERDQGKVVFLPTTDGDIFEKITDDVVQKRLQSFEEEIRIVWVGTFSGLVFLKDITTALELFAEYQNKKVILTVVCDAPLDYHSKYFKLENIRWTHQAAIDAMLSVHVGIMPLKDTEGNRGKCSFKLIQYLSAGLPIVGTTVGMNKLVLKDNVGKGVETNDAGLWLDALKSVTMDEKVWKCLSVNALKEWKNYYGFERNLKEWTLLLD